MPNTTTKKNVEKNTTKKTTNTSTSNENDILDEKEEDMMKGFKTNDHNSTTSGDSKNKMLCTVKVLKVIKGLAFIAFFFALCIFSCEMMHEQISSISTTSGSYVTSARVYATGFFFAALASAFAMAFQLLKIIAILKFKKN